MSEDPFFTDPEEVSQSVQQDTRDLITLGHLEEKVEWCGHTFVIQTLRMSDELQIANVTREYIETIRQVEALGTATVALSLVSVDGDPRFCEPLGPSDRAFAQARFDYVSKWSRPLISKLYSECLKLGERQIESIKALEDLSSGSRRNFWPSPDSLKLQGDYPSPTEDITELLTD